MSRIQLVAETPRAGKWNHRFIVSPTGDLSDSEVAKVVAAARRNLQGEDYLAVSVKTAQSVSGRTGDEILVLTGIEVNKLSSTQRQQIMVQLEQRLAELAVLVTEKIDWERAGQSLLVERAELVEWEKAISNLLRVKKAIPPVKKPPVARKWHPNQLKLAGGIIGILLVFGLGIWIGSTISECPKPQSQKPREVAQSNHHESVQNTPGGLGPVQSQPEASNDNLLGFLCENQLIAVNPDNFSKDINKKPADVKLPKDAKPPKPDVQKIDSDHGTPTPGKSSKSLSDSIDVNSGKIDSFIGKGNDSEEEKFFTELQKISAGVNCEKESDISPQSEKDVSFICEVLKTTQQSSDVATFKKTVESKKWCLSAKEIQQNAHMDKLHKRFKNATKIQPVINFVIQQLSTSSNLTRNLCPETKN